MSYNLDDDSMTLAEVVSFLKSYPQTDTFFHFLHHPAALDFCLRVMLPHVFYITLKVEVFAYGEKLPNELSWMRKIQTSARSDGISREDTSAQEYSPRSVAKKAVTHPPTATEERNKDRKGPSTIHSTSVTDKSLATVQEDASVPETFLVKQNSIQNSSDVEDELSKGTAASDLEANPASSQGASSIQSSSDVEELAQDNSSLTQNNASLTKNVSYKTEKPTAGQKVLSRTQNPSYEKNSTTRQENAFALQDSSKPEGRSTTDEEEVLDAGEEDTSEQLDAKYLGEHPLSSWTENPKLFWNHSTQPLQFTDQNHKERVKTFFQHVGKAQSAVDIQKFQVRLDSVIAYHLYTQETGLTKITKFGFEEFTSNFDLPLHNADQYKKALCNGRRHIEFCHLITNPSAVLKDFRYSPENFESLDLGLLFLNLDDAMWGNTVKNYSLFNETVDRLKLWKAAELLERAKNTGKVLSVFRLAAIQQKCQEQQAVSDMNVRKRSAPYDMDARKRSRTEKGSDAAVSCTAISDINSTLLQPNNMHFQMPNSCSIYGQGIWNLAAPFEQPQDATRSQYDEPDPRADLSWANENLGTHDYHGTGSVFDINENIWNGSMSM